MKITFLVAGTPADDPHVATLSHAHDVEVISIPRLVERHRGGTLDAAALAATPGSLVPEVFDALAELAVETALEGLTSDILITGEPATLALAAQLRPAAALVHLTDLSQQAWTAADQPVLSFAARADALISSTEHAARWLSGTLAAAAPPITAIPCALPPHGRLRSSLAAPVIFFDGPLAEHAVQAFAPIAEDWPDWSLHVACHGSARNRLARLVDAANLHDQVRLAGDGGQEELAKAALRVITGTGAGSGQAQAEAYAVGVPVIAYDHPGVEEFVEHDVNGWLVPARDTAALGQALVALMADEATRVRLGQGALGTARRTDAGRYDRALLGALAARPKRAERAAAHALRAVGAFVPPSSAKGSAPLREDGHVRCGQRLALVAGAMGPHEVALLNLDTVVGALREGRVPFWVLRDRGVRHRVAVHEQDRNRALACLGQAFDREPVYAQPIRPRPGTPTSGLLRDAVTWPPPGGLRVFRVVTQAGRQLQFGADTACDLEFWAPTPDGGLSAPRATIVGDVLPPQALRPAELTIAGRRYPSLRAFVQPLADDVSFPIDAVYTWVDGADPAWRGRRQAALEAAGLNPSPADGGESRYSSRDELRFSLRSLAMYAPWISRIWIVTDRQRPAWLRAGHPGVRVVDHREIFADASALPTFNSHAIETQLHRIDGLAEHFLYLNDDFFLGRPLTPAHFFHPSGVSKSFASPTTIPPGQRTDDDPTWIAAAKNNRALIEEAFGRGTAHAYKHAPYALRRSVLQELHDRFAEPIAATARSRVRAVHDVSVVSSLYHYYGLCTGRAVAGELSVDCVPLSHSSGMPALTRLLALRDRDAFCLNDMASGDLTELQKWRAATGFLEGYFPVPSPYE